MARPTGSCPPGRKPLLSDRETALGRRSFRPSPCRGRHPSSPRRRGGSNIHSYFWPMWLKYSFPLVAQILVPTWLKYSLTFTRNGSGTYIRAHRKSLNKAKEKLKLLTKRNRGRNVRRVMAEVKVFIRGWLGYFHVADMKRTMKSWDEWLRRRFRMYIWKQWKKPRTKVANLRKLGIPADKAYQWGNSRLGYWRIAGSPVLACSITNERLATAGYFGILNCYESLHSCD